MNPILFFLVPLVLIPSTGAFDYHTGLCTTTAQTSSYQMNLQNLLHTLPGRALESGFYNASMGQDPDRVYALYLCEADISATDCSECIYEAHVHILVDCGLGHSAILWSDLCMLRFSNTPVFQNMSLLPNMPVPNSSYPLESNQTQALNGLMGSLVSRVANSRGKYGTAMANLSGSCPMLYAVGQCTPDLSNQECEQCMKTATAIDIVPKTCGGSVYLPSCIVRFDPNKSFSDTPDLSFSLWDINHPVSPLAGSQLSVMQGGSIMHYSSTSGIIFSAVLLFLLLI